MSPCSKLRPKLRTSSKTADLRESSERSFSSCSRFVLLSRIARNLVLLQIACQELRLLLFRVSIKNARYCPRVCPRVVTGDSSRFEKQEDSASRVCVAVILSTDVMNEVMAESDLTENTGAAG